MHLCLPALWPHASPCPGAALPDVHLLGVSAELSLLLFLLRKAVESSSRTQVYGVPLTSPGTEPRVSPWPPAVPGCCASLSTQLWPPPHTCHCFASQVVWAQSYPRAGCANPLVWFPDRGMKREAARSSLVLSTFTACSDIHFGFQIQGWSQAAVRT